MPAPVWIIASLSLVALRAPASAQPIRETPQGWFVAVPSAIEVTVGGSARLHTVERGPMPKEELLGGLPRTVPVYEVTASGDRLPGVRYRNRKPTAVGYLEADIPTSVYFENGDYRIELWTSSREANSAEFPAGYVSKALHGSGTASILYGPLPRGPAPDGPFQLIWMPDVGTYPAGAEQDIARILQTVKDSLEALLPQETVSLRVVVLFAKMPKGDLAFTDPMATQKELPFVVQGLQASGELGCEQTLYNQFPAALTIGVKFANNQVTQVGTIRVIAPLNTKWGGIGAPPQDATITFRFDEAWDYDVGNGIVDPGTVDFEAVVRHELLHAMGFGCLMIDEKDNRIAIWDLFRLQPPDPGQPIDPGTFVSAPRILQAGLEAVWVTCLNDVNWLYRASTGPAAQGGDGFGQLIGRRQPCSEAGSGSWTRSSTRESSPRSPGIGLPRTSVRSIQLGG